MVKMVSDGVCASTYSTVLLCGSWIQLAHLLQSIDWLGIGQYYFHPQLLDPSFLKLMSSARAAKLPPQNSSISDETLKLPTSTPSIALIGAAPFMRLCRLQGMQTFHIHLSDLSVSANLLLSLRKPRISQMSLKRSLLCPCNSCGIWKNPVESNLAESPDKIAIPGTIYSGRIEPF